MKYRVVNLKNKKSPKPKQMVYEAEFKWKILC